MKTAGALAALGTLALGAWLFACASDEDASLAGSPESSLVPGVDPDAGQSDAGDEPGCVPDAICPFGAPFDASTRGGALDLRTRIASIRGRSASDVWAVGAHGAVAHFDGASWSRSEVGSVESFHGIWLHDAGEFALSSFDVIYARSDDIYAPDGGVPSSDGWRRAETSAPGWWNRDLSVSSAWAPVGAEWTWGTNGTLDYHSQSNGLWRARIAPGTGTIDLADVLPPGACALMGCMQMQSIHGSSPDDLWAVGRHGAAFRVTRAQSETPAITAFDTQTWATLDGVWAASPTDAWAVGGAGTIRHYAGGAVSWDVVDDVPTNEDLHAVWGTSSADIWAVGDGATVLHYDGATWSRVEVAGLGQRERGPDLFSVWTASPGHVWIGGEGVILSLGGKP